MKNLEIPAAIRTRTDYKRKFSFREMYRAFTLIPSAGLSLWRNKRKGLLSPAFVERLQLAVTEVNGCAACSYAHAYLALKQGMGQEEINSFLSGDGAFVQPDEARAILFAQYFAEARGYPDHATYEAIVQAYGRARARIILAAVQLMLVGNIYGLPYSAWQSRRKGKPFANSSRWYEISMLLGGVLCLPVALIHGLLRMMLGMTHEKAIAKAAE
jgi:AhpD family alkylhydroperoxidase